MGLAILCAIKITHSLSHIPYILFECRSSNLKVSVYFGLRWKSFCWHVHAVTLIKCIRIYTHTEGERETGSPPKTIFNEDESVNHVHLWHYKRWFCPKIIMKWFHSVIRSSGFDSTFQWSLGNEPTNNSSYREMDEAREEKNSSSKATYEINDVDDSNMHIFTLDGSFRILLWLWHFAWFPCHKCVCSLWAFASELNEFCGLCTKQRLPNDMNVRKY